MDTTVVHDTGMELRDLLDDPEFAGRTGKKRNHHQPFEALRRLTQVFAERPKDVLQELVNIAVSCCGADSAGISLVEPNESGEPTFRWIAIAGSFEPYLDGRTPRFFSPSEPASTGAALSYTELRSSTTTSWVSLPNRSWTGC